MDVVILVLVLLYTFLHGTIVGVFIGYWWRKQVEAFTDWLIRMVGGR